MRAVHANKNVEFNENTNNQIAFVFTNFECLMQQKRGTIELVACKCFSYNCSLILSFVPYRTWCDAFHKSKSEIKYKQNTREREANCTK